jgi:hypothetical protein
MAKGSQHGSADSSAPVCLDIELLMEKWEGRPNVKWCGSGLTYSARLVTAPDSPNPPRLKTRGLLDVM